MEKIKTTYIINFDAQLSDLTSKVESARKSLQKLMDSGNAPQLEKTFSKIDAQLDKLRTKASTPIRSNAAFGQMENNVATINTLLENLNKSIDELAVSSTSKKITLLPANEQKKINDAIQATQTFIKQIQAAYTETVDLREAQQAYTKALKKTQQQQDQLNTAKELAKQAQAELKLAQQRFDVLDQQKKKAAEAAEQVKKLDNYFAKKEAAGNKVDKRRTVTFDDGSSANYITAKRNAQNLPDETAYTEAAAALKRAKTSSDSFNASLLTQENALKRVEASEAAAKKKLEELNAQFANRKAAEVAVAYENLAQAARQLGIDISGIDTTPTEENLAKLAALVEQFTNQRVQPLEGELQTAANALNGYSTDTERVTEQIQESSEAFTEQNERAGQIDGIMARAKAFVGLQGAANIARRALSDAFNTVKELDAQMTEMAVVTDDNIGGYWDQLPEYTKRANALGVSIKSTYEAATLYYQQGLKTNEVIAVSNETLKMARISGLSAAEATNRMTAALRGFNMEVNEANAQRIDDVYSKLAAITASDVDEISSAMTKTASIASSAGMKFETTAAFLSQIIETTRESAETAGTALKTVIARFQELKKDPSEIGLVDGEEVDANQIETALKAVDVALRDTNGEFRQLDQVFLDLAAKWNTLDTNTQRYIATIAAGSRQQSRFIAMMQDYSRTQELVNAANNAAGTAQEQYGKTLDSLETKLNNLKNSWDTFVLGLTNNQLIKVGVDVLNALLTGVNALTQGWDAWSGSVIRIAAVTAALIAGDKAIKIFRVSLQQNTTVLQAFGNVAKSAGTSIKNFIKTLVTGVSKSAFSKTLSTMNDTLKKSSSAVETMTKTSAAYIASQKKLAEIEDQLTKKIITAEEAQKQKAEIETAAAVGAQEHTKAATELGTALGFSTSQTAALSMATATGSTVEEGAILAKAGLSAATIAQMTAEQRAATVTKLKNASGLKAILITANLTVGAWLHKVATDAETGAQKKGIIATIAATIANKALEGSLWPIFAVVSLIVVAIVALIGAIIGIVALVKWFKANSPEGKIKKLTEAVAQAAEEANKAVEAYNSLLDSLDSYKDTQDALKELTYGTREWKEALLAANNQVLTLLNTYPELANYIERGEQGQLTIKSEGFDKLLEWQAAGVANAQSAQAYAQMNLTREQIKQSKDALSAEYKSKTNISQLRDTLKQAYLESGQWSGLDAWSRADDHSQRIMNSWNDMANAYANNANLFEESNGIYSDQLMAIADAYALSAKELIYLKPLLDEYNERLQGSTVQLQQQARLALNNYASAEFLGTEYAENLLDGFAAALSSSKAEDNINKQTEKLYKKDGAVDIAKNTELQRIWTEAGLTDLDKGSNDQGNLEKLYARMKGVDLQTVKDAKKTKEELAQEIAAMDFSKTMAKNMEDLSTKLQKQTPKVQKEVAAALSDGGKAFTREMLDTVSIDTLKDAFNLNEEGLVEKFGVDIKTLTQIIEDNKDAAREAFTLATKTLSDLGLNNVAIGNNQLTSDMTKKVSEKLVTTVGLAGTDAAQSLNDNLNQIFAAAGENSSKVANLLTSINWQDAAAIDKLPEQFKELGITIAATDMDNFIQNLKDTNHAITTIDLESVNEQLETTSKIVADIKSGEQGRTLSDEQYNILSQIPELADKFSKDLSGNYVYLGESMLSLQKAIEDNTASQIEQGKAQLLAKLNAADILSGLSLNNNPQTSNPKDLLKEQLNALQAAGVDLNNLGIMGLSNATNVENLTTQAQNDILAALQALITTRDTNATTLTQKLTAASRKQYLAQDVTANSIGATIARKKLSSGNLSTYDQLVTEVELKGYTDALTIQANELGVSQTAITNYTATLAKLDDKTNLSASEQTRLTKEVEKFERILANTAAFKKTNSAMKTFLQDSNDAFQNYQKLTTEAEKLDAVQDMVDSFGITATKDNVEELANLIGSMSVGEADAFEKLMTLSAESYGVTDDLSQLFEIGTIGYDNLTKAGQNWVEAMVNAHRGLIIENENGVTEFVSYTKDALEGLAEQIGTLSEKWENPYTWLYNANERINALIRERTLLEDQWENNNTINTSEMLANLQDQVKAYQKLAGNYQQKYAQYLNDASELIKEGYKKGYQDLYSYDVNSGTIQVDYAEAEKRFTNNQAAGDNFNDFIDKLEENRDGIQDVQDALLDSIKSIQNKMTSSRDSYIDMISQIRDGLIDERQKYIDELSMINDTIKETQTSITDKLQEQITDQRNARELEKTASDLNDKQAQLNYLRASGGSELEIRKLQKEIDSASESYTDTLIDNALSDLQDANAAAAEQREQQINLATAQLEAYSNSQQSLDKAMKLYQETLEALKRGDGFDSTPVYKLLMESNKALSKEDIEKLGESLKQAVLAAAGYADKDTKNAWDMALQTYKDAAEALAKTMEKLGALGNKDVADTEGVKVSNLTDYTNQLNQIIALIKGIPVANDVAQALSDLTDNGKASLTEIMGQQNVGKKRTWLKNLADQLEANGVDLASLGIEGFNSENASHRFRSQSDAWLEDTLQKLSNWVSGIGYKESSKSNTNSTTTSNKNTTSTSNNGSTSNSDDLSGVQRALAEVLASAVGMSTEEVEELLRKRAAARAAARKNHTNSGGPNQSNRKLLLYKAGGLANYTGPAWLDGTPSKPEMVLNATDTSNFIQLKDILAEILRGGVGSVAETKGGNNYYSIDIQVDELSNDYDVDQVADHIKEIITNDAMYRNVNAIERTR